jgi:hypothetical protein
MPNDVVGDVALHATITAGQLVYHDGTGWAVAVLTNATTSCAVGVALVGGSSGEYIPVLTRGRLTGWTGLTAGGRLYSAAAGVVDSAHPQYAFDVGFAISTTDWFFNGVSGDAHAS